MTEKALRNILGIAVLMLLLYLIILSMLKAGAQTQGEGAAALLVRPLALPIVPAVAVLPDTNYDLTTFGAIAMRDTNTSGLSNLAWFTNWLSNAAASVVLAWDPSPSTGALTYAALWWHADLTTNRQNTGTNLTAQVILYPPGPTNILLTVTATNGGTNLARSTSLSGPWLSLQRATFTATNPLAPYFFRAQGRAGCFPWITLSRI